MDIGEQVPFILKCVGGGSQRIPKPLNLLESVRTKHQPHMGEVLDMSPTWSLPQEEIRGSYESHALPAGTPLPPLTSFLQDQLHHL